MGNMKTDSEKLIDFCQGRSAIVHRFSFVPEQFALGSDTCKVLLFREVKLVSMYCIIWKDIIGLNDFT